MDYATIVLPAILIFVVVVGIMWSQRRKHTALSAQPERLGDMFARASLPGTLHRPTKPNALVVGDLHHPGMLVQHYVPTAEDRIETINLRKEQLSGLEALVRHVPAL